MATDIGRYVPLKTIVSYACDELDKSIGDFDKMWLLAFRGLVKSGFSVAFEPKTVRLPISGNKTVAFPNDYLSWTKIGILNANGEISTLKINTGLTTYRDANPNRLQQLTPDINDNINGILNAPFYYNYYYNGGYNTLYGVGTGLQQFGECTVDEVNGLIVLSPYYQYQDVMLEYLSSPEKDDDYQVPTVLQETIIAFIKWKLKLGDANSYYAELTEARRSLPKKKVTLQGISQVIRESEAQKVRS